MHEKTFKFYLQHTPIKAAEKQEVKIGEAISSQQSLHSCSAQFCKVGRVKAITQVTAIGQAGANWIWVSSASHGLTARSS